jgi:hypothetical protein
MTTMAEAGVPPSTSDASDVAEIEIPTNLPSEKGMDYVPLATMLATGQMAEADQVRLQYLSCGLLFPSSLYSDVSRVTLIHTRSIFLHYYRHSSLAMH